MASIATLTVTRGNPRIEFVVGYGALCRENNIDTILMPANMYLDTQRNILIERALTLTDAEWLVWIDDDIGFEVDQVRALCNAADYRVVSGIYKSFGEHGWGHPVIYDIGDGEFTPVPWDRLPADGGPVRVDACGAGFLAVHRSVYTDMAPLYESPNHWFDEPFYVDSKGQRIKVGEDFGFCLRLRDLGIPIYARPDVIVKHVKMIPL